MGPRRCRHPLATIAVWLITVILVETGDCESRGEWACLGDAIVALAVAAPVTAIAWWLVLRLLRVPRAGMITGLMVVSVPVLSWLGSGLSVVPWSLAGGIPFLTTLCAGIWTRVLAGP